MAREMVTVENILQPGKSYRVDAEKYGAARRALLALLPDHAPGMTQKEMMVAMREALASAQFPGTTSSWWMKTAQLDLEAKGMILREATKPLRWRRCVDGLSRPD